MYADPARTWAAAHPTQKGFVLHDTQEPRYLNGGDHSLCNNQMSHPGSTYPTSSSLFNQTQATSASPQHRNAVSSIICIYILFYIFYMPCLYACLQQKSHYKRRREREGGGEDGKLHPAVIVSRAKESS